MPVQLVTDVAVHFRRLQDRLRSSKAAMLVLTSLQGHFANAEAVVLQLYSICCYASLLPPCFSCCRWCHCMTASSDTKGHASLQVKLVWCCTHSCGLISNLPCDPYGSCHVLEVQPHGQMPRLQKHIILDILRSVPVIVC